MPRPTSICLGLYQRIWIISFMHIYDCLLASMLYLHVCLSRSRPCHVLCPPWACACRSLRPLVCVVAFVPLLDCLDVTICVIHLCGVGVLDTQLSLLSVMLLCLPCLLCATCLAFFSLLLCIFARLPTCSCMSLCVVHALVSWNYGHPIQT